MDPKDAGDEPKDTGGKPTKEHEQQSGNDHKPIEFVFRLSLV